MSQESRQVLSSSNQANNTGSQFPDPRPSYTPTPTRVSAPPIPYSGIQQVVPQAVPQAVVPPADNIYHRPVPIVYGQRRPPPGPPPVQSAYYYRPLPHTHRSVSAPLRPGSISNSSTSSGSGSTSNSSSTSASSTSSLRRMDTLVSTYPSQRSHFGVTTPDLSSSSFLAATSAPTSYLGPTSDEPMLSIDPKYVQQMQLEDSLAMSSPVLWASSPSTSSVASHHSAAAHIPMSPGGYTTVVGSQYPSHLHYLSSVPNQGGSSSPITSGHSLASAVGYSVHPVTNPSNNVANRGDDEYDYYRRQEVDHYDRLSHQPYQVNSPVYHHHPPPFNGKHEDFGGALNRVPLPPPHSNDYNFNDSKRIYTDPNSMDNSRQLQKSQSQLSQPTHYDSQPSSQMPMPVQVAGPEPVPGPPPTHPTAGAYYSEYPSIPEESDRRRRGHSRSQSSYSHPTNQGTERKYQCPECGKFFRRDLPRHLRTHQEVARFVCPYPRAHCPHKRGQFNRPYDFKKHLLHSHFVFDDQKMVRSFRDLKSKLVYEGTCVCGVRYRAGDWLDQHVFGTENQCPYLNHH